MGYWCFLTVLHAFLTGDPRGYFWFLIAPGLPCLKAKISERSRRGTGQRCSGETGIRGEGSKPRTCPGGAPGQLQGRGWPNLGVLQPLGMLGLRGLQGGCGEKREKLESVTSCG